MPPSVNGRPPLGRISRLDGLRDFRGLWKRKAAGIVVGGGGALAAAAIGFAIGGPIGGVVGGVGSLLITPTSQEGPIAIHEQGEGPGGEPRTTADQDRRGPW